MARVRFALTFYGGKAEEHKVSAARLAEVIRDVSEDLKEAYQAIVQSKGMAPGQFELYVVARPKATSFSLRLETETANERLVGTVSRDYIDSLAELREELGGNGRLPGGLTLGMLERAKRYCGPIDGEYEGIKLAVVGPKKSHCVVFDKDLRIAIERKSSILHKVAERELRIIEHYEVEGVMYGLEDEAYEDPTASVIVKIDTGEHSNWLCRIKRSLLPDDLSAHWKERVRILGTARITQRKREIEASQITPLGQLDGVISAAQRFIKENESLWQGQDLVAYMDRVRERR